MSMATNNLTLDENHVYRLGGRVVPSVTQVINAVIPGWQANQYYLDRGSALHLACRYHDEGRLDENSVDPAIAGRLEAWKKFRAEFKSDVLHCELSLAHPVYSFAGTLDRVFDSDQDGITIVDLKSSISPQVRLQLAAYCALFYESVNALPKKAAAVELREDGTYRALWMTRAEIETARRQFLAALTLFGFMSEHKLLKERT